MTDKKKMEQIEEILKDLKDRVSSECSKYTFTTTNDRLVGLSESEQERILKEDFDNVFLYNSDDELISSCNDEYNLGNEDYVASNGAVNLSIMLENRDPRKGFVGDSATFKYVTCVRGAGYIVIIEPASVGRDKTRFLLYADKNRVARDYKDILDFLNMVKTAMPLIADYIKKNGIHVVTDGSYARRYV